LNVRIVKKVDRFNTLPREIRRRVSQALGETAQESASIARQLSPVDTGQLRDSIFYEQEGELRFAVGAAADYAQFVEEGTVYQEPQPFLRPAVELARKNLDRKLRNIE
jgi:HK97 gp10 family phage protein